MRRLKYIIPAVVLAYLSLVAWNLRTREVTLPNGFILRGETLLASDRRLLVTDLEFVCFDDHFLIATSVRRGQGGLFEATTQSRVPYDQHPEIYEPGGLKYGPATCNGYYTGMLGAGLIHGERPPFLPNCGWVNRDNPNLQNRAWLERPCVPRDWPAE